jgi:DNA mismatch repair ATPase MutS
MDDGIEANASTFALEMRETAFILHNVGLGSMIIMDELGRGTSTRDGLAIALSVCEAMIKSKVLLCSIQGNNSDLNYRYRHLYGLPPISEISH